MRSISSTVSLTRSSERTEGPATAFFTRGDILTIADRNVEFAGKPRPAVVLQSSHFVTMTLTVCPITGVAVDAPLLGIALPVSETSGLAVPSWAQIDKIMTISRRRIGGRIGHLDNVKMFEISQVPAGLSRHRRRRWALRC
jgi:mRNA-degrading endonuclease toxin of MazEF toxin-antitoxin module